MEVKTSDQYKAACNALREVLRYGDSTELLALRYLAGVYADEAHKREIDAITQQTVKADRQKPR